MFDELVVPDLKGWQVCLALAEGRLAKPDFRLDIQHKFDLDDEEGCAPLHLELDAHVQGLSIEVLRAGRDLVKLRMALNGTLTVGEKTYELAGTQWDVVTAFEVVCTRASHQVVANLGASRRSVNVGEFAGDRVDLQLALERWADAHGQEYPILLFSFETRTGQGTGVHFTHYEVTTACAEVSSVHSSFLLLMSDAAQPPTATPPVIDPHILPQGETAVLWLDLPTLERSSGTEVAKAAEQQLKLRPRYLGIDLPGVNEALSKWVRTIIDNVTLPKPLKFTAMQMGKSALKLSATPLSLDELDELTGSDLTVSRESLVQTRAQEIFGQCALYHLDESYRKQLLGLPQPDLPLEIREVAKPHGDWLRDFARLQVALLAKRSDRGDRVPYSRLRRETIEEKLKARTASDKCLQLIDALYSLAFCLVRPRLSLYLDQRKTWLPLYKEHLAGIQYRDRLLRLDDPVAQIHDDAAKLRLLGADGKAVLEFQDNALGWLLGKHAEKDWKDVIAARPAEFREGLERVLAGLHRRSAVSNDWIARAGGAKGVANKWGAALMDAGAHRQFVTIYDLGRQVAASMRWVGESAVNMLTYSAGAAVMATLLAPTRAVAADAGIDEMRPFVHEIADWFVNAVPTAAPIPSTALDGITVTTAVVTGLKAVRKTIEHFAMGPLEVKEFFNTVGRCFAIAGAALSLISLGLNLAAFARDLKAGRGVEAALDAVSGMLSGLSFALFLTFPASPWGGVLMVVALAIGIFRLIWGFAAETEEQKAAEQLVSAIDTMDSMSVVQSGS